MEQDWRSQLRDCLNDEICASLAGQTALYLSAIILSSVLLGVCLAYIWMCWPRRPTPPLPDAPQEPPIQSFARKLPPSADKPRPEAGNVFFMLFGAVAVVGLLGSAVMSNIKGPTRSMATVTQRNVASTDLMAASQLLVSHARNSQTGDCDSDGSIEPLPWREPIASQPAPSGGGLIPMQVGAAKSDPWKNDYGYCVWDHGDKTVSDDVADCGGSGARRLSGVDLPTQPVIAIISSGPDRVFQTTCHAWLDANDDDIPDVPLIEKPDGSDDLVRLAVYGEAILAGGGSGQLQSYPDQACTPAAIGLMRFEMGTVQVCSDTGWVEVGGVVSASGNFDPVTSAVLGSEHTSNEISFAGFNGTRTVSVDNGAAILVNGVEIGATASIAAGDMISVKGTAAPTPETDQTFTLTLGAIARPWIVTTRDSTPAALTITPTTSSGMNVTGPGAPTYGDVVSFVVQNTGEMETTLFSAVLSNVTNFEFYSGGGYVGDDCAGKTLAKDDTCVIDVRPKATVDGALSSTLTVADGTINAVANLSGTAAGWQDTTPNAFNFTDLTNQLIGTLLPSNILQISGVDGNVSVSITGQGSPEFRVCSNATCSTVVTDWTAGPATIQNNQRLQLRLTSGSFSTSYVATVTVGTFSENWSVSTGTTAIFAGAGAYDVVVPADLTTIRVKVWGAGGGRGSNSGGNGGGGGYVTGVLAVTPGETLRVVVGGGGSPARTAGSSEIAPGGTGGNAYSARHGGGGGASGLKRNSTVLLIAPGGGGGGGRHSMYVGIGGAGGGNSGANGTDPSGDNMQGGGATQSSGGGGGGGSAEAGSYLQGGNSHTGLGNSGGGGGGGGRYGGGAGGSGTPSGDSAGGGGGSALVPAGGSTTAGSGSSAGNTGDGDYGGNAGRGGVSGSDDGMPGRIVIKPN
ncbi:hypothetical protein STVA_28240 [Allostella vacuolata]|nr:hypothetical protein STVA_28240 [Stella vacuolata]